MSNVLRLTRELVERLSEQVDERGPILMDDPFDEYYDKTAAQILCRLH